MVMTTSTTLRSTAAGSGRNARAPATGPAKLSAATAEFRKPDSVTPI